MYRRNSNNEGNFLKKNISSEIPFTDMFTKLNSVKEKIVDAIASHPKAATVGAGLAVGAGIVVVCRFCESGNTNGTPGTRHM